VHDGAEDGRSGRGSDTASEFRSWCGSGSVRSGCSRARLAPFASIYSLVSGDAVALLPLASFDFDPDAYVTELESLAGLTATAP
jgi:hypothetical protein